MADWLDNQKYIQVMAPSTTTSLFNAQKANPLTSSQAQFSQLRAGDLSVSAGTYGGVTQAEANRMPMVAGRFLDNNAMTASTNNQLFGSLATGLAVNSSAYASMLYRNAMNLIVIQSTANVSAFTALYNEIVRDSMTTASHDAISLTHNEYAAINGSSGTITNMYGLLLDASWGGTSTETVTNFYGFKMANLSSYVGSRITNLWGVYLPSGNNHFGGNIFINDTSNASMTTGLTINQGAADNEILTLKSSDIAHGITAQTETDTYGYMAKTISASGGLNVVGFTSATIAIQLVPMGTTDNTAKSTAAIAYFMMDAYKKSGTDVAAPGADANIAAFRSGGTTRFILDADGDSHEDVGTSWTNFADHNDVGLLETLSAGVSRKEDPLRTRFGEFLKSHRAELEELKLVTFNDDGHHFLNMSRLSMLLTGACIQLGHRVKELERRIDGMPNLLI